ncbi:MAG: adenosylmethionine--8-amino-7-oxononanoate transaminase [Peptostreptococcaceae bacterium]
MNLVEKDLKYIWHPCSQMKDYETFNPIVIESGDGVYLYDIDGNEYIDAISSWWCNLFGHANKRINKAISNQVNTLEHVIFANFTHKPAVKLCERIIQIAPDRLKKVFFTDNGSASVECALKMSFQYHAQVGNEKKKKFVAITDAYHGETIGALSVGDLDLYSKVYKPIMLNTARVEGPDCYRCKFKKQREYCSAECFLYMQEYIEDNHEEIASVIIEPMVQGAAGMKIYSPIYLRKLRDICDKYDIHLIADEIAVGFGRTGKMFACEHADVSPDFMCLSKGLTAGYVPMALVLTTDKIYDAFYDDYSTYKAFMHSHTYSGNPIGCTIANEVLDIFEDEDILLQNQSKAKCFYNKIQQSLGSHEHVGEIRSSGLINAIELVVDKETKEGFDSNLRLGYKIYQRALKKGVLLRPLGNVLYFNPPYVICEDDMDKMIRVCKECIDEVLKNL